MINITKSILPLLLALLATSPITAFSPLSTARKNARVGGVSRTFTTLNARRRGVTSSDKNTLVMMPQGTPMVPWQPPGQEYAQFVDIYSRLYRDRIILIGQFIDEEYANNLISTLLYLKKESPDKKISLYFNSPGGLLRPALAVYDLLCSMREECEISTLNLGLATGMSALLCGAGTKGLRTCMPNSRYLLQRTGMEAPFQGQASDIGLEVANMKKYNDRMEIELAKMTGKPVSKIREDMRRDFYLSSEEAVRYGLIDSVLLPAVKGFSEVRYERDPWTGEQVLIEEDEAGLGVFGGSDEQRYGDQTGGGWGTGWKVNEKSGGDDEDGGDDDDYEPPLE